jgi:hypothetical protein
MFEFCSEAVEMLLNENRNVDKAVQNDNHEIDEKLAKASEIQTSSPIVVSCIFEDDFALSQLHQRKVNCVVN